MDNALTVASINDYPVQKFNRLFPATLTEISPLHKVMVNIVTIDTDPIAKEVYEQKQGNGLSLTKTACLKLMTAANVVMKESKPILPQGCQRCIEIAQRTRLAPQCNGCPTKLDKAYQVSILVPEPSGGHREYIATKELAKADYKGLPEHMAAQCETKALLRALRAGLDIKGAYAPSELTKPFAVALVVLNTQDPDLKAAMIKRFAAGQDALFGGAAALPAGTTLQLPEANVSGRVVVVEDEPEGDQGVGDIPPWELPPVGTEACCEVCRKQIQAANGWTVEQIVTYLKEKRGRVVCNECYAGGGQ